jgi:PAS domain S-box-containing protein
MWMAVPGAHGRTGGAAAQPEFRRVRAALLAIAAIAGLLTVAALGLVAWDARRTAVAKATAEADNLAVALEQHAGQIFQSVGLVFRLVAAEYQDRMRAGGVDPLEMHRLLRELTQAAPQLRGLFILDADGIPLAESRSLPPRPFSGADRAYFRVHREGEVSGMFVDRPVRGRVTPDWRIIVSHRLEAPDGQFAGVIVAAIHPRDLADFYGTLDRGRGYCIALHGEAGFRLVTYPYDEDEINTPDMTMAEPPWRAARSGAGWFARRSGPAYVAFRALERAPLVVSVSFDEKRMLADWRRSLDGYVGAAVLVLVTIAVLTTMAHAQLRRREATSRALAASESRLHDLVDCLSDWVWEQDAELRYTYVTPGALERLGLDPAVLIGRRREETGLEADPRELREHLAATARRLPFRDFHHRRRLPDGRTVHLADSGKPLFDAAGRFAGYRGTGRDITAQVEARQNAARHERRLYDAVASFPEPFALWDAEDRLAICNDRFRELFPPNRRNDLIGRRFEEVLRLRVESGLVPEAAGREEEWIARRIAWHRYPGPPREARLADGRWMMLCERRTDDGGVAAFYLDITRLKNAEMRAEAAAEELRRNRDLLQAVLDHVPARISVKDRQRRYVLINKYGLEMWGLPAEQVIGRRLDEFVPPATDPAVHRERAGRAALRDAQVFETGQALMHCPDTSSDPTGAPMHLLTSKIPLRGKDGAVETLLSVSIDITPQKRAEERAEAVARELARSRDMLRLVIDNVPATISVKDSLRRYILVNKAQLAFWGVPIETALGKRFDEFMAPRLLPAESAAMDARIAEYDRLVLETGRAQPFYEEQFTEPDGSQSHYLTSKLPLPDVDGRPYAVLTISIDITERKRAELRTIEANQRLADYAQTSSDWLWQTDPQHVFVYMSDGVRILGVDPDKVIGKSRFHLATDQASDPQKWRAHLADLEARRPFRDLVYSVEFRGEKHFISVSGKPVFGADGAFLGYRGTGRLVTAQVRLQRALLEAKTAAEVASRAKSEFLANMSHELRTPLNAVIGFSEMLSSRLAGPLTPKQSEYLNDIRDSGRHLLQVINDVLDLAKIEAGRLELREEEVDVVSVVGECVRLVRERAANAGIELVNRVARPIRLRADEMAVKKILTNLLSNAVKFTQRGGRVTVEAATTPDGGCLIAVRDTGIGMAPEDIPKALEPFGQIDSALTRRHQGTGLGLPLAQSLVQRMGGELGVESEPGKGTTVTVRLPPDRVYRTAA